ncbi:hypothetical protein TKK_0005125 [Trichogramma kaykai]|uniref:Tetratricopeptide repeat protein 27 n=1 Tax=Trichogramma kaykai TaxID=54128 RepID=A0ABD2XJH3_9HYME
MEEKTTISLEKKLILNEPLPEDEKPCGYIQDILDGNFESVLNSDFFTSKLSNFVNEEFGENVKNLINSDLEDSVKWFHGAIASLYYFIQNNYHQISGNENIDYLLPLRKLAINTLALNDDQCNENVAKPELLYFAKIVLNSSQIQKLYISSKWWLFRAHCVHQAILDNVSEVLFKDSEELLKQLFESQNVLTEVKEISLFNTEVAYFYSYYSRIQSSEKYLNNAAEAAHLSLCLEGALGKRTKYQREEKAQLYLKPKLEKEIIPYRSCEVLPKVINLSDDLRLEKIAFTEDTEIVKLGSYEQAIVLAAYFHLLRSQPKDLLRDEEIISYLNCVIDNTDNWCLKVTALYQRCLLEAKHKRTIDRTLMQLEYLNEQLCSQSPPVSFKMDLFFASGIKPQWCFKQHLADVMRDIGLEKGALDIYLDLGLWEQVIGCYTHLGLKHKAAEIIKQELAKKPTVKLWCWLGDAENEEKHYKTAWELSGEKSSIVQRHWGFYYYIKQNYKEAIPHLKRSVELNNIQENVWVRLGFAALQVEDWQLAASAYRHYNALEQSSFEVWNNLAKAYIELGDKQRAWRSLQDALKCNYDKWEVWDNLMVVSIDLGHFSEVIRCYERLLELKGTHVDVEVLAILTKAIVNDVKDFYGNSSRQYLKRSLDLFGNLTSKVLKNADIWLLYAELTLLKKTEMDNQKAVQYIQRAYHCENPSSFKTVEDANRVLMTCIRLAEISLYSSNCGSSEDAQGQKIEKENRFVLKCAKLILQSVITKMQNLKWADVSGIEENLTTLKEHHKNIKEKLEEINESKK